LRRESERAALPTSLAGDIMNEPERQEPPEVAKLVRDLRNPPALWMSTKPANFEN
jgi:hypothetical protein